MTQSGNTNVTTIKKTYNTKFDMKSEKNEVLQRLNDIDVFKNDPTSYNKIMWVVDNMYLPNSEGAENYKVELLTSAGIIDDEYTIEHARITDDDIEVVQQMVLWYFTNSDDTNYNGETLPELYFNNLTGTDGGYKNFEDLYNDPIIGTRDGLYRQQECEMLYTYFLNNAKTKDEYVSQDTTSPLTLDKTRVVLSEEDESYIVGPFRINKNTDLLYTINKLEFTDESGNEFEYVLLDEDKQTIENDITKLYGKDFYIKVRENLGVSSINFDIDITYTKTVATYYTTDEATYKDEQPVVLVEKEPIEYQDKVTVQLPAPKVFDLSLRKFISEVNGKKLNESREPVVDVKGLVSGTSTTAIYDHPKNPLSVEVGDIVTYTIRVYNEGEKDGYVSEITDHLPVQLKFLEDDEENIENGWYYDENDTTLRTIRTSLLSLESDTDNLIKAFDGENLYYKDVTVKCKVIADITYDRRIVNIAEITEFTDKNGNTVIDRDSQADNVGLPTDENLPNYKQEEIDRGDSYIPGNQDDDDFDSVQVVYFDLALRKFITKVDNLDINNRYPELSIGEDGNIKYTHTKEPVSVANGNIVTYTIRIYNEGTMAGYASEITDDLPEGLLFLPQNETNTTYRWIMIDKDGNETEDVEKAVKITTDYLSKEQETESGSNLIKAFNKEVGLTESNPDYKDVKVAFKVTEPNTSDRILINTAEISEDTNKDGKPVEDIDSIPGNNKDGEDDIDIDKVKVKYFDLALKKWVTQAIVIENGKETITNTGHTGNENPEPVVKVDLKAKNLKNVTVKFKYSIKVTNEGQIEGYVKEIKDYIPEGLKFVASDNPKWTQISENQVTTDQVKDLLLKPGESTTVDIILTWVNGDKNLGVKVNWAEISKDYNNYDDTPDIDSTPDNYKEGEDDIDNAPIILAVKTGETTIYFGLTTIILITLAGGIYLIKKFVL